MTLDEILAIPYEPNGRSQSGADCYGIVRMARERGVGQEVSL
jgi:hypothetical protein